MSDETKIENATLVGQTIEGAVEEMAEWAKSKMDGEGEKIDMEGKPLERKDIEDALIKEPYEGDRILESAPLPDFLQKPGELTKEQRQIIHDAVSTELGGPVKINQEYFIDEKPEGEEFAQPNKVTVTIGIDALAQFIKALLEKVSVGDFRKSIESLDYNLANNVPFYSDAEEAFYVDLADDVISLLDLKAVRFERETSKD